MPSTFSWLDHSEEDRRRILDVIDQFKETDTRDELGLGSIRDGIADALFPGTSTIQTRARYFLFVPWMYQRLHDKGVPSEAVAARARKEEIKLLNALIAAGESEGVIGRVAGATLQRLPSNIYWQGLGAWQIRLFPGSQDEYHRRFDHFELRGRHPVDDDGERLGHQSSAWHSYLPEAPANFPDTATLELRERDAQYLAERICFSAPSSLLAFLVKRGRPVDAPYAWAHPQIDEFPTKIRQLLHHAQLLSEAMNGAALLYNLMLAEEAAGPTQTETVEAFRIHIAGWAEALKSRREALSRWDRSEFWALAHQHAVISPRTRVFVDQWVGLQPWASADRLLESTSARALIRDRERQLKGPRARIGNTRALELWSGASGTAPLAYRWRNAARILNDLYAGMEAHNARA